MKKLLTGLLGLLAVLFFVGDLSAQTSTGKLELHKALVIVSGGYRDWTYDVKFDVVAGVFGIKINRLAVALAYNKRQYSAENVRSLDVKENLGFITLDAGERQPCHFRVSSRDLYPGLMVQLNWTDTNKHTENSTYIMQVMEEVKK